MYTQKTPITLTIAIGYAAGLVGFVAKWLFSQSVRGMKCEQ